MASPPSTGDSPPERQGIFDRFAGAASHFVSTGAFFGASVLLVLLWLPTIFVIPKVDTWQLVLNTVVSVLAFVLIALLQNSERRNDEAMHRKLDALAAAVAELLDREAANGSDVREARERLRETIELERDI
jgi:low affinity Fe/Cu permease